MARKKKNSNGLFIAGSILGAVAGAAVALWRTPMSGQELRSKLTPGPVTANGSSTPAQPGNSFTDKVIGVVEKATAPIVGVELGKTANGSHAHADGTVVSAPIVPDTDGEAELIQPEAGRVEAPHSETVASGAYGETTNTGKRFGWGDPAPSATENAVVVNEHADAPGVVAAAETEPTIARPGTTTDAYGETSIRAKRFSWGDPAPAVSAADVDTSTTASTPVVESAGTSPTSTQPAVDVVDGRSVRHDVDVNEAKAVTVEDMLKQAPEVSVMSAPAAMHKFPKLGGLEK